jgi:hypothetical protein
MFAVIVGGSFGGEWVLLIDVLWPQLFTVALWRRGNSAEITRGKWADRLGTIQIDLLHKI